MYVNILGNKIMLEDLGRDKGRRDGDGVGGGEARSPENLAPQVVGSETSAALRVPGGAEDSFESIVMRDAVSRLREFRATSPEAYGALESFVTKGVPMSLEHMVEARSAEFGVIDHEVKRKFWQGFFRGFAIGFDSPRLLWNYITGAKMPSPSLSGLSSVQCKFICADGLKDAFLAVNEQEA